MTLLVDHCSDAFGDAATAMVLLGRTIRCLADPDLAVVLAGVVEGSTVVRVGLGALVRGLPPEVVELLEGLQR